MTKSKLGVRQALDARELIKVTLLQNTDENIHEVAEILEEGNRCGNCPKDWSDSHLVQTIEQKENRKISAKVKEI